MVTKSYGLNKGATNDMIESLDAADGAMQIDNEARRFGYSLDDERRYPIDLKHNASSITFAASTDSDQRRGWRCNAVVTLTGAQSCQFVAHRIELLLFGQ